MRAMEKPFHITVCALPVSGARLDNELRFVKAAILYGDRVRLYSSIASAVLTMHDFKDMSLSEQVSLLEAFLLSQKNLSPDQIQTLNLLKLARQVIANRNKGGDFYKGYLAMKREMPKIIEKNFDNYDSLFQSSRISELKSAIAAEILDVHKFEAIGDTRDIVIGIANDSFGSDEYILELAMNYTTEIFETVQNGQTYPLFDDKTGEILRLGIDAGLITPSPIRVEQGKETGLASDLIERLPLFDEASIPEILDIRNELEIPLTMFRQAVISYAKEIRTASWESDFSVEADQVFREKVAPAVIALEEAVKSNRSLADIATKKLSKEGIVASSFFSFVISQLPALSTFAKMSLMGAIFGATAVRDIIHELKEQNRNIEQNQVYFFYKAKQLLSDGTYQYNF